MSASNKITLRTAVILPFVIIFLFTIGVIIAVQKSSYEEMVRDVSKQQLSSLASNVHLELDTFLSKPFEASLSLSHNIGFHQLYRQNNMAKVEKFLLSSFTNLYTSIPHLDAISFGGEGAEFVGFRKESNNGFTLMMQDGRTNGNLVIYRGRQISDDIRSVFNQYDPRVRPWYTPVSTEKQPIWSPIYANADERQEVTLSALTPVFTNDTFNGVVVADIKINTFNAFLNRLKQNSNATVYIFDEESRMVAHPNLSSVVSWGTHQSSKGDRLLAIESSNPIIESSAKHLERINIEVTNNFTSNVNGERYFNLVTPYFDQHGIHWHIGVSMSETDLLGNLPKSQRDSWVIGIIVSIIGVTIGLIAFSRITTPITSTVAAAKHLAKGDWNSAMPKPGHIYETSMLVYAFNEMANNLKVSFKALRTQLIYDSLTRLYSREGLIQTYETPSNDGCLLLIGINKFRDVNDSLGHHKGDQLLMIIAERLKSLYNDNYVLARIGGDEFAIYIPHLDSSGCNAEVNRIMQMFASPISMEGENIVVSASIGVVQDNSDSTMIFWLRNGSIALSNAKRDPSNVSHYSPEMADISRQRTQMQAKIKQAIERHEFVPFYQPIVELHTGKIVGAEALARWLSPSAGLISPLDFIPIAEDSGLIGEIGEQILRQSCIDTVKGIEEGKWGLSFQLHVNLSVNQLSQPGFISTLENILIETGLNTQSLTLEITESRIVDNDPIIAQNMRTIRELGVEIAIDDFGTGYSSLAYLHRLPFDCLKIDRAFVDKLDKNNIEDSVVSAIINMTRSMNVSLVAEGIETQEQAEILMQLECPLGQGFLYSRPVPFDEWPTDLVNMK